MVIERFNRTLKNIIYKKFTENGNQKWIVILDSCMEFYNNKIHSSIVVSPFEASENPKSLINSEQVNKPEKPKFHVLDRVRIFKYKNKFEKGFTYKWIK